MLKIIYTFFAIFGEGILYVNIRSQTFDLF